jgi:hypothetical protein
MHTTITQALQIPVDTFLITASAIRNRHNSNKTKNSDAF